MGEANKNIKIIKIWWWEGTSKQIDSKEDYLFSSRDWIIEPSFDFETLLYAYENSSTISWIVKKIANIWDVWFVGTENDVLDNFLSNLDITTIFQNMLVFWNCFIERLKDLNWDKTIELEPIITTTVRVAVPKDNWIDFYQRSKRGITKVPFTSDEILFFKNISIWDKKYWDSIFFTCIDEITLLAYITKYYKKFFKSWNIEPTILYDKNWVLTDDQITKIENMIKDLISWVDKSFSTIVLPSEIWKIDLSTRIDPDKFIALKRELKEDIAIATNIPFSLLSPENSNKAISQTDINSLYRDIVMPLQKLVLRQIKKQLKKWKIEGIADDEIDSIKFVKISLKDWLEEMKILTWYQEKWTLSQNEVRIKAELWDPIIGGDEYIIHKPSDNNNLNNDTNSIQKIKEEIKKSYEQTNMFT